MRMLLMAMFLILLNIGCEKKVVPSVHAAEEAKPDPPTEARLICYTGDSVKYDGVTLNAEFYHESWTFTDKVTKKDIETNAVCFKNYDPPK